MNKGLLITLIAILGSCSPYTLPEPKEPPPQEDPFTYYQESLEEYEAGRYDLALEKIQRAITIHQNFAQFYRIEGDIYRDLKDYDKALQSYAKAIIQRSNFIEVHISMAELYTEQENYWQAIKSYRKILALKPEEIGMYLDIAQCFIALEELQIALNNLGDYKRDSELLSVPVANEYYLLKGIAYYNLSRFEDVVRELKPFEYRKNANPDMLYLLGRSYYAVENYEDGLRCFNRLISKDAFVGEYYYYRGIYFYIKEDFGDAKEQFDYALQLDDSLGKAHYYLGKIYEAQWDVKNALSEFYLYHDGSDRFDDVEDLDEIISRLNQLKEVVADSSR
jgi:tetratricopeptide (TPR) repeat protein